MSNVIIDKNKIDLLANAIAAKSGESLPLTLAEMVEAVDGIQGGGGITPTGNIDITQAGTTDVTNYATATVPTATIRQVRVGGEFETIGGNFVYKHNYMLDAYGFLNDGYYYGEAEGYSLAIPSNTVITPTESAQTVGGGEYVMEGAVTVNAIPSNYVGTGITRRSSSDLTASGATVTVPAGYYSAQASKAVASGTAGTPTASKGTVYNHAVSVTPSVTNTAGYITGGTKTGTAVSVSASELVSGSETKTANGTYDVTNLAEIVVNVSGGGTSKNAQTIQSTTRATSSSYTKVCGDITVAKTGTYNVYWSCFRSSTSGTSGSQLYIGSSAYGSAITTFTNHISNVHLSNVSLTANQKISVYARSRGSNYYAYVGTLTIIEA